MTTIGPTGDDTPESPEAPEPPDVIEAPATEPPTVKPPEPLELLPKATEATPKNSCKFCQAVYPSRKELFEHLPHCHRRETAHKMRSTDLMEMMQESFKRLEDKVDKYRLDTLQVEEQLGNLLRHTRRLVQLEEYKEQLRLKKIEDGYIEMAKRNWSRTAWESEKLSYPGYNEELDLEITKEMKEKRARETF